MPKPLHCFLTTGILLTILATAGCSALSQSSAGLTQGELSPCPSAPRCVSSQADDPGHSIAPFQLRGQPSSSWQAVQTQVEAMPRTRIVNRQGPYIHAEVISPWHVYTDDLELLLEAETGTVDVRSSARIGYYDFNVNRDRVEALRKKLKEAELIR